MYTGTCNGYIISKNEKNENAQSGNWTRVSRVTGGDTSHYTIKEMEKSHKNVQENVEFSLSLYDNIDNKVNRHLRLNRVMNTKSFEIF